MRVLPRYKEDEGVKCSLSISLKENVKTLSLEDARIIANYMESCIVIYAWLSSIKDPISGLFEIPSQIWTDGQYAWESSHIHYVKNYRVRLPDEFMAHVRVQLRNRFDGSRFSQSKLCEEFDKTLSILLAGDESPYVAY